MEFLTAEILLAGATVLGMVGGGIKYVLGRMDQERIRVEAERIRYELRIETERHRHEELVSARIAEMQREVAVQEREINHLRRVSDAYLRHISILERLMRAAGIEIPTFEMPPFPPMPDHAG